MQNLTKHAKLRIQQRGIRCEAVQMILRYGAYQRVKGGKTYFMDKAAHQRASRSAEGQLYRRLSDRLGFYVIVGDDGQIITVAHSRQRRLYFRRKPPYDRSKRS